jgi:hypothetical protein
MYFGEFLCYWCVYLFISAVYCIFSVVYYVFLLYSKKNTNRNLISGAPFLMSVAHPIRGAPKWGEPQIICVAHVLGCATGTTHIRGAYRRVPQIKYTYGLICMAHHRCATKPQNGAPQIEFLLVVLISYQLLPVDQKTEQATVCELLLWIKMSLTCTSRMQNCVYFQILKCNL